LCFKVRSHPARGGYSPGTLPNALQRIEQVAHLLLAHPAGDEHHAAAAVPVRPGRSQFRVAVDRLAAGPKGHGAIDPPAQFGFDVVYFELDRDALAADECPHGVPA
jgi:hypothetical protein